MLILNPRSTTPSLPHSLAYVSDVPMHPLLLTSYSTHLDRPVSPLARLSVSSKPKPPNLPAPLQRQRRLSALVAGPSLVQPPSPVNALLPVMLPMVLPLSALRKPATPPTTKTMTMTRSSVLSRSRRRRWQILRMVQTCSSRRPTPTLRLAAAISKVWFESWEI
jgi:hypothetical protein